MIKEFLILVLFLKFSNGNWGGFLEKKDLHPIDPCGNGTVVIQNGGWRVGEIHASISKIWVPQKHQNEEITYHPGIYLEPISQTDIKIELSRVQILRIDSAHRALTISLKSSR